MRKAFFFLCFFMVGVTAFAQQLARARNVALVTQPNTQLVLKGGINFIGTADFTHKGNLTLLSNPVSGAADWRDSTTGVFNTASYGQVAFKGAAIQQVVGPTRFDSVTVQNSIGIHLPQSNEVRQWLNLNNGLVSFTNPNDSLYVSNTALSAITYNTDSLATTSWVQGKLSRRANITGGAYFFPIGKMAGMDSLYAPLRFEKTTTGAATYSAQYFPASPANRANKNPIIDHISNVEYWEITSHNFATAGDDDAILSMSWRDYSIVNPAAIIRDSLLIAHYFFDGAFFQWQPEYNGALPNDVNGNVNFGYIRSNKVIGDFSMPHLYFTIGTRSGQNLLPVSFINWTVAKQNHSAYCTWEISDDREVDFYIIERSTDGISFSTVGTVMARQVSGNAVYSFTDHAPIKGMNFYRIKAQQANKHNYTIVKSVYFTTEADWILFPNPATSVLTIQLPVVNSSSRLLLIDVSGKLIAEKQITTTTIQLSVGSLPAGLYYLQYINDNHKDVKSFIKK